MKNKEQVQEKLTTYNEVHNMAVDACKEYYDAIVGRNGMTVHDVEIIDISKHIHFHYFNPWEEKDESYLAPLSLLWGEMDVELEKEKNEIYQRNLKIVGL